MSRRQPISYAQKQLPFSGTSVRAIASPFKHERRALQTLAALGIMCALVYGYAMVSSIAAVAARQVALKESRTLSASLGTIEATYLSHARTITPEYAAVAGFVPTERRVFVSKLSVVTYR